FNNLVVSDNTAHEDTLEEITGDNDGDTLVRIVGEIGVVKSEVEANVASMKTSIVLVKDNIPLYTMIDGDETLEDRDAEGFFWGAVTRGTLDKTANSTFVIPGVTNYSIDLKMMRKLKKLDTIKMRYKAAGTAGGYWLNYCLTLFYKRA
ncbi:unnamed protein product, partial [marine sediment metagenome]